MPDREQVPYASVNVVNGDRLCPVCKVWIAESCDSDGESTTDNYGEHYVVEHGGRAEAE